MCIGCRCFLFVFLFYFWHTVTLNVRHRWRSCRYKSAFEHVFFFKEHKIRNISFLPHGPPIPEPSHTLSPHLPSHPTTNAPSPEPSLEPFPPQKNNPTPTPIVKPTRFEFPKCDICRHKKSHTPRLNSFFSPSPSHLFRSRKPD